MSFQDAKKANKPKKNNQMKEKSKEEIGNHYKVRA
jgi:hypothetical protein